MSDNAATDSGDCLSDIKNGQFLYPGSSISTILAIEAIAVSNSLSDKAVRDILQLLQLILPPHKNCPSERSMKRSQRSTMSYKTVGCGSGTLAVLSPISELESVIKTNIDFITRYQDDRGNCVDDLKLPYSVEQSLQDNFTAYHTLSPHY